MEYLLIMSLSGSIMTGIYVLARHLFGGRMSARLQYLLAKASVLYYLIPLPFLKEWYEKLIMDHTGIRLTPVSGTIAGQSYYIIHSNGNEYFSIYMKLQIIAVTIWALIAFGLFLYELYDYVRTGNGLKIYINNLKVDSEIIVLKRGKKLFQLVQKITLYRELPDRRTMTFGLFRPVILLASGTENRETEMVLEHEMTHIRRMDIFWKILMKLMLFLHWWNPAVWFLCLDFERLCEYSCDEIVLQDKSMEDRKRYMKLLISKSQSENEDKEGYVRWGIGLKKEARILEERIRNGMDIRKYNKLAGLLTAAALVMFNSLTVLAYPRIHTETWNEDIPEKAIDEYLNEGTIQFIPETEKNMSQDINCAEKFMNIKYEEQFIDEEGNIYLYQDTEKLDAYSNCSHNYIAGNISKHVKNSNGSCKMIIYSAKRCTICYDIVEGNRLYEINYDICPH